MDINVANKAKPVSVNSNLDLLVRRVEITDESENTVEALEIREWIKNAEVEGHGLFLPIESAQDLVDAIITVIP